MQVQLDKVIGYFCKNVLSTVSKNLTDVEMFVTYVGNKYHKEENKKSKVSFQHNLKG
jgi:hypothetical protein